MIHNESVNLLTNNDILSSCNVYSTNPFYSIMSATWEEKKLSFSCSLTLRPKGLEWKIAIKPPKKVLHLYAPNRGRLLDTLYFIDFKLTPELLHAVRQR